MEVSGGVEKDRLRELADTGINIISAGSLTHSAPAVDISMKIVPVILQEPAETRPVSRG